MTDKLKAGLKWILSFLKTEWTLDDYPVRFERWSDDPGDPQAWSARVINWWTLAGTGRSKEEAYEDLRASLAAAAEERAQLPRPGTSVPIQFAPDDDIRRYWGVTSRIISDVLGFDPEGIFVSNGSSLWDFAQDGDIRPYQAKIKELFGRDVSHIESGNLVEIAKYLSD